MKYLAALFFFVLGAAPATDLLPKRGAQQDFLPVDQAFELQPLERRGGQLRVEWRIAKGYYLYRERLSFKNEGAALPAPQLPKGEAHHDEVFGDSTVYRDSLVATFPAGAGPLKLIVSYQGCADAGLCYPPQTRTLELAR